MKILITAGGSREPIDAVRFISNTSTGATGAALADHWASAGHSVVLLRGTGATAALADGIESEVFSSAADLGVRLARRLGDGTFDLVVMAAAVADYRPATPFSGKISSTDDELTLQLVRTPKLLPGLKSLSPKPLRVVGFKLTAGAPAEARLAAVAAQFAAGGVDQVVQNDQTDVRVSGSSRQLFYLYQSPTGDPEALPGVPALAGALVPVVKS